MTTWNEEEDGMGFAGLVEPRMYSSDTNEYADAMVAQGERLAQEAEAMQTNAYAEGRKDEREATLAEFASLLPGSYYMDPPDGGSVTVLEQFKRMAKDAQKWREQQERIALAIACEIKCEG